MSPRTNEDKDVERVSCEHDFTEAPTSKETYYRVVFCRRCGRVSWFYNWSAEKNVAELQSKIGTCVPRSTTNSTEPPNVIGEPIK